MNPRNFLHGFQQQNSDRRTPTKTRIVFPHHKYHARTNAVSTRTRFVFPHHKYVADQQPTDRQFRTQLNRYYGHYHEHNTRININRKNPRYCVRIWYGPVEVYVRVLSTWHGPIEEIRIYLYTQIEAIRACKRMSHGPVEVVRTC